MLGRLDEAIVEIETALDLDPLSSIIHDGRNLVSILRRRYDEAIRGCRRILEFDPSFYKAFTTMGRAYSLLGNYDEALAMLEKGRALAGDMNNILAAIGDVHARAGNPAAARGVLAKLTARAKTEYVPSTCFALIHLGLGERDESLRWLEAACDGRDLPLISVYVHPIYDDLRGEARFDRILRRMRLPM
jgi:serine/threonine-protein kinase